MRFMIIDRAGGIHLATAAEPNLLPTELLEIAATVLELDAPGGAVVAHKNMMGHRGAIEVRTPQDTIAHVQLAQVQRRFGAGSGKGAFQVERSHLDDVEHDIAPPMAMAITMPLNADDAILYLATSPFRARRSGEEHLIKLAERIVAALERE